jgi:hypothetical protein
MARDDKRWQEMPREAGAHYLSNFVIAKVRGGSVKMIFTALSVLKVGIDGPNAPSIRVENSCSVDQMGAQFDFNVLETKMGSLVIVTARLGHEPSSVYVTKDGRVTFVCRRSVIVSI